MYFTAMATDSEEFSPVKPLVDFLEFNGFKVITKPLIDFIDDQGRRRVKGSINVELATEMLEAAAFVEHIVVLSGDGDLAFPIEAVQRKGCRVTVVSTMIGDSAAVSENLRRKADAFIDLAKVKDIIFKKETPARTITMSRPMVNSGNNGTLRVIAPDRRPVTNLGGIDLAASSSI